MVWSQWSFLNLSNSDSLISLNHAVLNGLHNNHSESKCTKGWKLRAREPRQPQSLYGKCRYHRNHNVIKIRGHSWGIAFDFFRRCGKAISWWCCTRKCALSYFFHFQFQHQSFLFPCLIAYFLSTSFETELHLSISFGLRFFFFWALERENTTPCSTNLNWLVLADESSVHFGLSFAPVRILCCRRVKYSV